MYKMQKEFFIERNEIMRCILLRSNYEEMFDNLLFSQRKKSFIALR